MRNNFHATGFFFFFSLEFWFLSKFVPTILASVFDFSDRVFLFRVSFKSSHKGRSKLRLLTLNVYRRIFLFYLLAQRHLLNVEFRVAVTIWWMEIWSLVESGGSEKSSANGLLVSRQINTNNGCVCIMRLKKYFDYT